MSKKNFESQALKQAICQAVKGSTYQLKGSPDKVHSVSTANSNKRVISVKK
jgi:hypothetical protein